MKKKKTWRLIGTGFDLDNNIICDIICEETQLLKSVIIKNSEKSREVLQKILENDNQFLIPKSIFVSSEIIRIKTLSIN